MHNKQKCMLLFLKGLSLVLLNTPRFLKKILVCSAKPKSFINSTILHVVMLTMPMFCNILSSFLHKICFTFFGSCNAVLIGLWLSVRHAVYKTDTAEDDKKKSNASLGRFTHLQAPVSKAHLLFEQWLCRSHASLALWLHRL